MACNGFSNPHASEMAVISFALFLELPNWLGLVTLAAGNGKNGTPVAAHIDT